MQWLAAQPAQQQGGQHQQRKQPQPAAHRPLAAELVSCTPAMQLCSRLHQQDKLAAMAFLGRLLQLQAAVSQVPLAQRGLAQAALLGWQARQGMEGQVPAAWQEAQLVQGMVQLAAQGVPPASPWVLARPPPLPPPWGRCSKAVPALRQPQQREAGWRRERRPGRPLAQPAALPWSLARAA